MDIETYEFPGWDRCMRCLCHRRDECPDLEYLFALQQEEMWWNSLSDEAKLEIQTQNAAWAIGKMLSSILPREDIIF